jgi:aminoglycoside phosphotransferase (APT) family kinase protein
VVPLPERSPTRHDEPVSELEPSVLRWVEASVGSGAGVTSVRMMPTWSVEMHELTVVADDGVEHKLVLRRYTDERHLGVDPSYDPANEARVLRLLDGAGVTAPRLYAADLDGGICGMPAILESWMPGEPADPRDVDRYLRSSAETLVGIHAAVPTRPVDLIDYIPYAVADGVELRPPSWTSRPGLWERVLDILDRDPPDPRACFIHRDYHQGNTLTIDDRVVAVIDWVTGAWGPPGIDLARMRLNLVEEVGIESERGFLEAYQAAGGDPDDRHPYWDLRDAADCLLDSSYRNDLEGHDMNRFETWVARVLSEIG